MFNSKEIAAFIIITLVLGITISFLKGTQILLSTLMAVFIVLLVNLLAKKIAAFYVESEIEIKPWEIRQFGFRKGAHFKRPFQAGIFFPIIYFYYRFFYLLELSLREDIINRFHFS